mgnify:FL=1
MAKKPALSCSFLIDGINLSGDIREVALGRPSALLDATAINSAAMERLYGPVDGRMAVVCFFNDATDRAHLTLRTKPAANRVAVFLEGATIGNMAAGLTAKQMNYDPQRGADGSLTIPVECLADGFGLDYCEQLTAGLRTDTAATNGASWDNGAATSLGLAAYLEVTAFTGTSVTVAIQESSDNAVGDPFAAVVGGAFAAASAAGAQRIATAAGLAVERYLRVVTTGIFTNAIFSVVATRSPVI